MDTKVIWNVTNEHRMLKDKNGQITCKSIYLVIYHLGRPSLAPPGDLTFTMSPSWTLSRMHKEAKYDDQMVLQACSLLIDCFFLEYSKKSIQLTNETGSEINMIMKRDRETSSEGLREFVRVARWGGRIAIRIFGLCQLAGGSASALNNLLMILQSLRSWNTAIITNQ